MNEIIEVNGARYRKVVPECPGSCRDCAGRASVTLCEMFPSCYVADENGEWKSIIYVEVL